MAKEKSLGHMIDSLYAARADRIEKQREVDAMKLQERDLQASIMAKLEKQGISSGRGSLATASITKSVQPQVADWKKVYAYIRKEDAFHLLHQRVASTAWRELHEAGKKVPGIEAMPVQDLSLTKASKG